MKIALAIAGIALGAVLLVSAAMAAGLIDTGSDTPDDEKLVLPASARPQLHPVSLNPLRVKGTGFVPGERVRVTEMSGPKVTRMTTAGRRGGFVVTMPFDVGQRCGATVTARGNKGSKAAFNFAEFACAAPATSG